MLGVRGNVVAAACALAMAAGGCATVPEPYLRWSSAPPSGRMDGKVAIKTVPNLRPPSRGDAQLADIGHERALSGQVTAIRLEGDQNDPLDLTITKLTIDAMRSSGLSTTQPEDTTATAHLNVEIKEFWCEGARGAKAEVTLELVLIDPATGSERLRVPVNGTASGADCRVAFRSALGTVYRGMVSAFAEGEVHAAAMKAPGAAAGGEGTQQQQPAAQ